MGNFWIVLYVVVTFWALGNIIFYGARPTKSLAWALAVITLPFAGPILYYLFGVNRRKFRFFKRKETWRKAVFDDFYDELGRTANTVENNNAVHEKFVRLITKNSHHTAISGNKLTLLNDGRETFDAIFEALEKAEKFIHLQYYIFEKGELTDRMHEIFKKKAAKGIEIRLIYDSFGSFSFRGKFMKKFKDIGVKAHPMLPIRFGNLLFSLNYRNHRKILIIDGKVGFTGGVNVSDKYIEPVSELGIWKDLHLKIEGPAVQDLHQIFIQDYFVASREKLLAKKKYLPKLTEKGATTLQMVASGPDSLHPAILQQYIAMVNLAKDEVCIANPYFIPSVALLQAIKIAALSGVAIKLLVPKKLDSAMAKYSMFSYFEQLLEVGVQVYLRTDFSHSKLIIIDGEMASVGSGNFDYRSFEHNYETNVIVYDKAIAQRLLALYEDIRAEATQLHYEIFKRRPKWQKYLEGLSKFFGPLL
ncbi:cardiolipin synthase [Allomuricauda sp. d1]|uniref:cardiolipin synthase n=1 Tax=Allomuricauda sp. d1 TaxID=3136725 RepID=UPI0031DA1F8F